MHKVSKKGRLSFSSDKQLVARKKQNLKRKRPKFGTFGGGM